MLVTVAEGALPVAVDAEVDVEVEEFGVWVVSDDVVAGGDVAVSGTAEVELELEVDVDDGEVVDVDVVEEVVDVDVEDVVEDVVDVDVEVEDEVVEDDVDDEDEIATNVEDVAVVGLEEDEVDTELDGAGAEVAVDEVETADTLDDVVTAKPHPLAGAGILSSSCPECPCLVESSSTSMSTNLLSPAE